MVCVSVCHAQLLVVVREREKQHIYTGTCHRKDHIKKKSRGMTQYKRQKTSNTMGNHGENGNGNGSEMPTDECFTQIRSMLKHSTSFGNETGTFPMATFEPGTKVRRNRKVKTHI